MMSDSLNDDDDTIIAVTASSKPIVHVPPRVDQDFYQAEVSESLGDLPYASGGMYHYSHIQ